MKCNHYGKRKDRGERGRLCDACYNLDLDNGVREALSPVSILQHPPLKLAGELVDDVSDLDT